MNPFRNVGMFQSTVKNILFFMLTCWWLDKKIFFLDIRCTQPNRCPAKPQETAPQLSDGGVIGVAITGVVVGILLVSIA